MKVKKITTGKSITTTILILTILTFVSCCEEKPKTESIEPNSQTVKSIIIENVINIEDISNKSLKEVTKILGKPNSKEKAKPSGTPCKANPCDKVFYKDGKFEIIFINGISDWITINDVSSLPMNEDVITSLGFPKTKPSYSNPSNSIKWTNIAGYKEISFFNNGSNRVDYIYIKINTR